MTASEQIDRQIAELPDWRGQTLSELRKLINESVPEIKEDWKWETAVFTAGGNICALGAFKDHLKINFFKGASLPDPKGLFNAGLEAKTSRSIDLGEGEEIDEPALQELIRAAVKANKKK